MLSKHRLLLLKSETFSPPRRDTIWQSHLAKHMTTVSSHPSSPFPPRIHGLLASANVPSKENYSTQNTQAGSVKTTFGYHAALILMLLMRNSDEQAMKTENHHQRCIYHEGMQAPGLRRGRCSSCVSNLLGWEAGVEKPGKTHSSAC